MLCLRGYVLICFGYVLSMYWRVLSALVCFVRCLICVVYVLVTFWVCVFDMFWVGVGCVLACELSAFGMFWYVVDMFWI